MESQLREDYKKHKTKHKKAIEEASELWLKENVIFLHEKLDRNQIRKLVNKIQKFEDTFGPYRSKIPTISDALDEAENGLQLVLTGKSSDRKASDLLKQMSYLYSTLSDFFSKDLPVLIKTNVFRCPYSNPDIRFDMIKGEEGEKYDPKAIEDAIANALKPSKEEKQLLNKLYKGEGMPELNTRKVARDMLGLCYNDLCELCKVEKVPTVASPPKGKAEPTRQDVSAQPFQEYQITEGEVYLEQKFDKKQIQQTLKSANDLQKIVSSNSEYFGNISKNISNLIEQAKEETSKTGFSLKKSKALKQLLAVQEIFDNLRDAWSDIGDLMQAGNVNEQTIQTIENRLTEYAQGGIFSKLISSFKTQPPNGLSVDDIVGNITNHLREVFNENPEQLSQSVANVGNALRGIPSTDAPENAQKAADKGYPGSTQGQQQKGTQQGSEPLEKVSQNVTKQLNLGSDQQQNIQGVLQKLQQAGYTVKKS